MDVTARALVPLSRARCVELLGSRPVGRVVFTRRALPEVLPVNYTLHDAVLFRVAAGSAVAAACRDSVVAFNVDDIDPDGRVGWSVTVVGHSSEVTDPVERARLVALGLTSWLGDSRDTFIRIALDEVTGREIVPAGLAAS
jgi:nitroimidazol reductase NimA-like FMN-containing flavoprotein (pyridoxamine 5'-phosphate oxidase superfamily)